MNNYHTYKDCIDACLKCAAICNHCASGCLQEEDVTMMTKCIQLDMECASICYSAAQVMSIGGIHAKELCKICASICEECAKECANHDHEHCKECAEACKDCAHKCRTMAA
ncbi:MAG: four-helix bundle copper-binding protein [Sphingobacterium sp.]